jgi:hypothetical protein
MPARATWILLIGSQPGQLEDIRAGGGVEQRRGRLTGCGSVDDRFRQPAPSGLDGTHHGQQLVGGGPVARVLGQAAPDQRPHLTRQPIEAGRAIDEPVNQGSIRPGTERPLARAGEGEDRAQAEHVTGRPDDIAQDLLRRHEAG